MLGRRFWGILLLLAVTAGIIGGDWFRQQDKTTVTPAGESAYAELLSVAPVAQVMGTPVSPDGQYEIRAIGESDTYASGYRIPESLQVIELDSGSVVWKDQGWLVQMVSWSPDGQYFALGYGGRTWEAVRIIETGTWTSWDFTRPDGSPIPEYTFLPENWCFWTDNDTLRLTIGLGGDSGAQTSFRCSLVTEGDGSLTGSVLEEAAEILSNEYDFDHDGTEETVELITLLDDNGQGTKAAVWYELQVCTAEGKTLYLQEFADAHVMWGSLFSLTLEGQDCLLRYDPTMFQGNCAYEYQVFSFDETGKLLPVQEKRVEFDVNFGSPAHRNYDPATIAAFLTEVHGYLRESRLLFSTEGGSPQKNLPGSDFWLDDFTGGTLRDNHDWGGVLREYEENAA